MNPTPEALAALRQSSDILAYVCDRAAKCDHLEARNKHLQEHADFVSARHGVLQAVIRKAREGLGNAIPHCRHMSLPELVIEAAARINQATSFSATAPQIEMEVMIRDLETLRQKANRNEERAMHLGVENIRLTGQLGEAKADLDRARRERDEARQERDAARGATLPIGEPAFAMAAQMMESKQAELDEARAENGRQAATIASLMTAPDPGPQSLRDRIRHAINCASAENGSDTPDFILAEALESVLKAFDVAVVRREEWYGRKTATGNAVRIETTHTGRDNRCHFRAWMEGDSPQSHPNERRDR